MQLEVGKIIEGKVTGITKFGAFVELEPGTVGMVHISEVSSTYINDIAEVLKMGQTVTVKVLSIGEEKKISLSIKRAMAPTPNQNREGEGFRRPQGNHAAGRDGARTGGGNRPPQQGGRPAGGPPRAGGSGPSRGGNGASPRGGNGAAPRGNNNTSSGSGNRFGGPPQPPVQKGPPAFEDMLSKFITSSDEKISGMKKDHTVNRRAGSRKK